MMKNIFIIVSISFLLFSPEIRSDFSMTPSGNSTKLFSGSIQFPCKLDHDLCLFYKGQKLEFESNNTSNFVQFSFLDSSDTHCVYLVVTNGLTCLAEHSNLVESLQIPQDHHYVCYKMQGKREYSAQDSQLELLTWTITEHHLSDNIIPNNSLIFLFDPNLIAGLKVQSWKPENVFRIIPTLLITPDATIQQLNRAMIVARLAALDIDSIHAKKTTPSSTSAILTAMQ
jgi:hypothetical protein